MQQAIGSRPLHLLPRLGSVVNIISEVPSPSLANTSAAYTVDASGPSL